MFHVKHSVCGLLVIPPAVCYTVSIRHNDAKDNGASSSNGVLRSTRREFSEECITTLPGILLPQSCSTLSVQCSVNFVVPSYNAIVLIFKKVPVLFVSWLALCPNWSKSAANTA